MSAPFYENYTRLVTETDLVAALGQQLEVDFKRLHRITEQQGDMVHPPYTWTVKEALGHLIDGEIIFAYRAFRFSRRDATPLSGFDENEFIVNSNYNQRTVSDILTQLELSRQANIALFASLPAAAWDYSGTATGLQWKVSDLAKALIGHIRHHQKIIEQRCNL